MEEKIAILRRFFKVMLPDFQTKLILPPAFCKKIKQEESEWAILKSRKGTWKIKVCRNLDGLISFHLGWTQFVDHHTLGVGDLLFFEHIGGLQFNVVVYDPSACEKEFESKGEKEEDSEPVDFHPKKRKRVEKDSITSFESENLHFIMIMKPQHANKHSGSSMYIPADFVRSNNLAKKSSASLRDDRGRVWAVYLVIRRVPILRVSLGQGWNDFYVSNDLKEGDVCDFYIRPSSPRSKTVTFDVKIRHV